MKIALSTTIAGFALALMTPSLASSQSVDEGATEDTTNASNTVICRRTPAPTGTRIGSRRICKTEAQWQRLEEEQRTALENSGLRSRFGNEDEGLACQVIRGC